MSLQREAPRDSQRVEGTFAGCIYLPSMKTTVICRYNQANIYILPIKLFAFFSLRLIWTLN